MIELYNYNHSSWDKEIYVFLDILESTFLMF